MPKSRRSLALPHDIYAASADTASMGYPTSTSRPCCRACRLFSPGTAGGAYRQRRIALALQERTEHRHHHGLQPGPAHGHALRELDPAVVLHLMREDGLDIAGVEALLYRRSGMLGLSGLSSDFRDLLASDDPRARFAIEVFAYRVTRGIGSLAAALGGLDGLVFTAGVGENAAPIRAAVCEASRWLGIVLDAEANVAKARTISHTDSRVAVHILPTDENLMIARHTRAVLDDTAP